MGPFDLCEEHRCARKELLAAAEAIVAEREALEVVNEAEARSLLLAYECLVNGMCEYLRAEEVHSEPSFIDGSVV
jgi:hypothetical protein